MRLLLTVLLTSAACLTSPTAGFADTLVALSGFQLDGVTPRAQYLANQQQLRVMVEGLAAEDADRTRDVILQDEFDASMVDMEMMQAQEPVCTPARKALLALMGTSEMADPSSNGSSDLSAMTSRQAARSTTASEPAPRMPVAAAAASAPARWSVNDSIPAVAVAAPPVRSSTSSTSRQTSTVAAVSGSPSAIRGERSVRATPTATAPTGTRSARPAETARFSRAYPVRDTTMVAQMRSSNAGMRGALRGRTFSARR